MKFSKIKNSHKVAPFGRSNCLASPRLARRCLSGETLIEVLIAVSVLMITLVPSAGLKVQSVQNLAFNRDHLIAETLADEGIEIIRNIRDTNFLKFSDKKEECWNTALEKDCGNKIEAGSYVLKRDINTLKWNLEKIGTDILADDFNFPLDSAYRLKLDSGTQLYNHDSGDPTNFYREIYLEYDGDKKMNVLSRVFFKAGAKTKIVKRFYYLTNQTE